MTNPNSGDQHDRTNPPSANQEQPIQQSYGSGYNHGRAVERQRYETVQEVRDENNTANGFLIGILLTGLVLGGAALAYFVTQRNQTPVQRTIVVPSASPSPTPSPQVKERVIERVVPVPQPQQGSPTVIPAPNIRIEAPKPQQPAPQVSPSPSVQQSEPPRTEAPASPEPSPSPEASPSSQQSGQ